ncbi:MAG: hypothetical protein AAGI01_14540, partial [Myxococcota bacterium]
TSFNPLANQSFAAVTVPIDQFGQADAGDNFDYLTAAGGSSKRLLKLAVPVLLLVAFLAVGLVVVIGASDEEPAVEPPEGVLAQPNPPAELNTPDPEPAARAVLDDNPTEDPTPHDPSEEDPKPVTITVDADGVTAKVYDGGDLLGATPYEFTYEAPRTLRLEAAGRKPETVEISDASKSSYTIALAEAARGSKRKPRRESKRRRSEPKADDKPKNTKTEPPKEKPPGDGWLEVPASKPKPKRSKPRKRKPDVEIF